MKKNSLQNRFLITALSILTCFNSLSADDKLPKDVRRQLESYNVMWDSPSTSGSMQSLPIGNGDITANVWVEENGDLMLYIGKSDTWSESTRLLKVGRLRIKLSPNPFSAGNAFSETLDITKGEINISTGAQGDRTTIRIYVDANNPAVRIETVADRKLSVKCITELMRPEAYTLPSPRSPIASSFRGLVEGPFMPSESADILSSNPDRIEWFHRNESSYYPIIMERQNVAELTDKYPDPYMGRTFGATVIGRNMHPENDSTLVSTDKAKRFLLSVYAHTAQTESAARWSEQMERIVADNEKTDKRDIYDNHVEWWDRFWNRSWVLLSGDDDARAVTRAYLLQRYLMACQSRGAYPVKFNGGNFTFDYQGRNGDYRNWGPGYWFQNCRLYYWPLTATGDFDLLMPWFDMYMNMLDRQTDITKAYYGHGGAFFPETLNFFGMYIQDDWGWDNPGKASQTRWIRYHYSGAIEMLSQMLDYYDYTRDEQFAEKYIVPFATQVIRFFDQHWPRIGRTIRFTPANAIEQFWDCVNPVDYIAGLKYTITKLNALPEGLVSQALSNEWNNCLNSLPPLSIVDNKIQPAEEYGIGRNFENPECYAIFPFKLYGLGRPDMDIALNTFENRIFKQTTCWSQDPIQAPLLGLGELSRQMVMKNVNALDPAVPFPAFWKPGSDYIPDLDNGGVIMNCVNNMLLQCVGDSILVLPAFPESWSVDFKLHAFDNTTVRVVGKVKNISEISVYPLERAGNVVTGPR